MHLQNQVLEKNADDNQKLNGGNIDKVGKIEDKINLADEYLELFKRYCGR